MLFKNKNNQGFLISFEYKVLRPISDNNFKSFKIIFKKRVTLINLYQELLKKRSISYIYQ